MELKLDLNLEGIIAQACSAERLQPLVDTAVAGAIKSAIEEATGYRSEFRKRVTEQVAEAMPHGVGLDDVARFQQVFNHALTEAVHGANADTIKTAMQRAIGHVVPDVPSRVKLSELLDTARGGFHKETHEAFYAHLELSPYGGGWLYLDGDADCREKYRADTRISFTKEGDVYSVKFDGVEMSPSKLPTAVGHFDGLLLSMYVGRTSIEVDMGEVDVEAAAEEKYED